MVAAKEGKRALCREVENREFCTKVEVINWQGSHREALARMLWQAEISLIMVFQSPVLWGRLMSESSGSLMVQATARKLLLAESP